MKKFAYLGLVACTLFVGTGCARPGEIGWTPAYTARERGDMIARNWDYEGKQIQDDIDHILLLRPVSRLTVWNVR
jgi:hypothetical protein